MTALVYLSALSQATDTIRQETRAARDHSLMTPSWATTMTQVADLLDGLGEKAVSERSEFWDDEPTRVMEGAE